MILNTRNFFLYLLCVAMLIIAIAVTVVSRQSETSDFDDYATPPPMTTISNEAAVVNAVTLNREEKLTAMREKVASSIAEARPEPVVVETPTLEKPETEPVVVTSELVGEDRCDVYLPYQGVWDTKGLTFSVVEGARLLLREIGTSSSETVLQIPLGTFPLSVKSCVPSDVVGIALDGSLIRNGEYALYSVFGQETLVGYALDGFPIYGVTDKQVDVCGGVVVDGYYHYYLQHDSTTILNCYSGIPVAL